MSRVSERRVANAKRSIARGQNTTRIVHGGRVITIDYTYVNVTEKSRYTQSNTFLADWHAVAYSPLIFHEGCIVSLHSCHWQAALVDMKHETGFRGAKSVPWTGIALI